MCNYITSAQTHVHALASHILSIEIWPGTTLALSISTPVDTRLPHRLLTARDYYMSSSAQLPKLLIVASGSSIYKTSLAGSMLYLRVLSLILVVSWRIPNLVVGHALCDLKCLHERPLRASPKWMYTITGLVYTVMKVEGSISHPLSS